MKPLKTQILFILFLFPLMLIVTIGLGQDFSFRSINKTYGSPTNTIYDVLQDSRGFIWLGTDKGLYRYDGKTFKHYGNNKQDGKSISNIHEDFEGKIWCQNFSGQHFFTVADSLQIAKLIDTSGEFYPSKITGKGRFHFSFKGTKLRIYNLPKQKIKEIDLKRHFTVMASADESTYYLFKDETKELIGIDTSGRFKWHDIPVDKTAFYHAKLGNRFYFTNKIDATKLWVYENGRVIQEIPFSSKFFVQNMKTIDEKTIGIFTSTGFLLFDISKNEKLIRPQMPNLNTSGMIKDFEGNLWLSTINSGVVFIPSREVRVLQPETGFTRFSNQFTANELFVGTSKGSIMEIQNTNSVRSTLLGTGNTEVTAVLKMGDKLLFNSDKFYAYSKQKQYFSIKKAVKDIEQIDSNKVVLGATGSLTLLENLNQKPKESNLVLLGARYRSIVYDATQKVIYTASSQGLMQVYDSLNVKEIKDGKQSISGLDLAIKQGPNATIFVGTTTNGIYFIQNSKVVKHLTTKDGLEDMAVYKVKYFYPNLWWLTERVVQKMDLQTNKITTYSKAQGIPDTDLKDLAIMKDTVYVATLAGLVTFPVQLSTSSSVKPKIIINELLVNKLNRKINQDIKLKYDENNIEINFSVLSFRNFGENKIMYQLNGGSWNKLQADVRTLNLSSLSAGDYTIKFKVIDNNNIESEEQQVGFSIAKPFWQTYWFWALLIGVVSYAAYRYYQHNLARIQAEAKLKQEKLELERNLQKSLNTAIRTQMNPHFIFNALNSIQEQFLYGNKIMASEQMGNFTYLMRQILNVSAKQKISIATEVEILSKYLELEKMRFMEGFKYEIVLGPDIDEDYHQVPPLLVQPFVENAIRHGLFHKTGDKSVKVLFDLQADAFITCTIEDNGIGREKAFEIKLKKTQQYESFSTSATEERLRLLSNDLAISDLVIFEDLKTPSGEAAGTRVIVKIPLT